MKNSSILVTLLLFSFTVLIAQEPSRDDTMQLVPNDTVKTKPAQTTAAVEQDQPKEKKHPAKPAKRFQYGAHGGISSSSLSSSPGGYSASANIGFNAGIYLRVYIFKRLYVQPEINYYFSSYDFRRNLDGKEDKVKSHALQIPVLVGYTLFDKKAFRMLVQTGPAVGINVGVSDNNVGVTRDDFNSSYWSWIVDGQIRIGKIAVQGGFVAGLSNYAYGVRSNSWYVGMGFNL
jgi:hypothetical protein